MKKLMSLMVILTILISMSVNAADNIKIESESDIELFKTKGAIVSLKATDVPEKALNILAEKGAKVEKDSLVEILKITGTDDTAVCLTNADNGDITKEILISYVENESGDTVVDNTIASLLTTYTFNYQDSASSNGTGYTIRATAYYTSYMVNDLYVEYHRPYKCVAYYEKTGNNDVTISNMTVSYVTVGYLCTYPDFEMLGSLYTHSISMTESNPVANVAYNKTSNMASNRCLNLVGSNEITGMSLVFRYKVNGVDAGDTVALNVIQ